MPTLQPTHYTSAEGTYWKTWPPEVLFSPDVLSLRSSTTVEVTPYDARTSPESLCVHSLAFGDVLGGYNSYPRWDCVNGWTKELEIDEPSSPPAETDHEPLPAIT